MVGDTSGKEERRKIQTSAEIKKNTSGIKKFYKKFLSGKGSNTFVNLNNEKYHIIGHSMGASISVMYAATFPEKVDKLVLIEGFGPLTAKVENTVRNLRKALDGERLMFLKNKLPKLYPTMLQAIQARMEVVKTYPGQQFISKEAAISLVSR
jgi:pimeloyl-ACP methyl ester carboxylesterase